MEFKEIDKDNFNDDTTDNEVNSAKKEQDSTQGDNEDVDDVVTEDDSNKA